MAVNKKIDRTVNEKRTALLRKYYVALRQNDAETRREIELAAVEAVTNALKDSGFTVHDRQRENCGYDLFAVSASQQLLVEVKGTDPPVPI